MTEERQAHACNSPLKLGPPALKQQLVGIIGECTFYFQQHGGSEQGGTKYGGVAENNVQKMQKLIKAISS